MRDIALYGELCGPKIQKNPHGLEQLEFFVFDIAIDEKWQDWEQLTEMAAALELRRAPTHPPNAGLLMAAADQTVHTQHVPVETPTHPS